MVNAAVRAVKKSPIRAFFVTLGSLVLIWAVPYFLPGIKERVQGAAGQPPIEVVGGPVQYSEGSAEPIFAIPRPIGEIPHPPPADQPQTLRYKWARRLGGVDAGDTQILVIVKGHYSSAVRVTGLRVTVLERRSPFRGTLITYGPEGGPIDTLLADVDLDKKPPSVHYFREEGSDKKWHFPLRVSATEEEAFIIRASTHKYDCSWIIQLEYFYNGRKYNLRIDDHGRPFRTTPMEGLPSYYSDGNNFHREG